MSEARARKMTPEDGPAVRELCRQSPDSGLFSYYPDFHVNPFHGLSSQFTDRLGVVVEVDGHDGLIGVGDSVFGRCLFNGTQRSFAYMKAYHVHRGFRRLSAGTLIDQWLVQAARERTGPDLLLLGSVQTKNLPQLAMVNKSSGWTPRVEFHSGLFAMKTRAPAAPAGLSVERAGDALLEVCARGLNEFYGDYNLYEPQDAESLGRWLANPLFDTPFCHYFAALRKGQVVAGMGVVEEFRVRTFAVCDMPAKAKALNLLLKIVPESGSMRQIIGAKMWFAPGESRAGRFLFDMVRHRWAGSADTLICHYDPRGPMAAMLKLPPWRPKVSYYVMSVEPMDDRLVCPII